MHNIPSSTNETTAIMGKDIIDTFMEYQAVHKVLKQEVATLLTSVVVVIICAFYWCIVLFPQLWSGNLRQRCRRLSVSMIIVLILSAAVEIFTTYVFKCPVLGKKSALSAFFSAYECDFLCEVLRELRMKNIFGFFSGCNPGGNRKYVRIWQFVFS